MKKPRLLDLFCCAGGAGMGYARAGFEITGVDVVRHANNPHPVLETDALALDPTWIAANFDAVHASPPCQGYTTMRHAPGAKGAPKLIGQTRELLQATGLPWVIENVEAAAGEMQTPVLLCGTMFGLGAQGHDLQRHRLFETSFQVAPLPCRHTARPVIGVYGGHARNRSGKNGGRGTKDTWDGGHKPPVFLYWRGPDRKTDQKQTTRAKPAQVKQPKILQQTKLPQFTNLKRRS